MHSIENEHAPQEETPVEDTVTVSLREYQMMKKALEDMKRKNTAEIKGKTVIERTITPQLPFFTKTRIEAMQMDRQCLNLNRYINSAQCLLHI